MSADKINLLARLRFGGERGDSRRHDAHSRRLARRLGELCRGAYAGEFDPAECLLALLVYVAQHGSCAINARRVARLLLRYEVAPDDIRQARRAPVDWFQSTLPN